MASIGRRVRLVPISEHGFQTLRVVVDLPVGVLDMSVPEAERTAEALLAEARDQVADYVARDRTRSVA